jgi:hypothetical protein
MKSEKFLEQLIGRQFVMMNSALWSYLMKAGKGPRTRTYNLVKIHNKYIFFSYLFNKNNKLIT